MQAPWQSQSHMDRPESNIHPVWYDHHSLELKEIAASSTGWASLLRFWARDGGRHERREVHAAGFWDASGWLGRGLA